MHPAELIAFASFGAAILIVAWLPLWLERLPLTLPMLAVGAGWIAFLLLVVRPAAARLGFAGSVHPMPVRLAVGYFGIRGLGSLYYTSRAMGTDPHHDQYGLWPVTALTVLFSIVLYGVAARPALRLLDRRWGGTSRQDVERGCNVDASRAQFTQSLTYPCSRCARSASTNTVSTTATY